MSFQSPTAELVVTAELVLRGEMPLIEGCRKICRLRHKLSDPENGVFLPIRGIESETDHFPLGEARSKCATENLNRTDTEMEQYLAEAREDILEACRQIIQVFSRPTS